MNPLISGLKDKVVLVTGGASGIGLASAQALAASGAKVVCADLQQSQDLPQGCEFRKLDVTCEVMTKELVADMLARYGQIDGLLTSAGISAVGDLEDLSLQEWDRLLQINLTGTMLSARAVAAAMKKRQQGSIVTLASIYGMLGNQGNLAYCAAKGAVLQLTRAMAADLGRFGVRVNSISPGYIQTPMTSMLEEIPVGERFKKLHLLKRAGLPAEVGNTAAFLLSDLASFVTGANIPVDGGFSAAKVIEMQ